jgi:Redoxin
MTSAGRDVDRLGRDSLAWVLLALSRGDKVFTMRIFRTARPLQPYSRTSQQSMVVCSSALRVFAAGMLCLMLGCSHDCPSQTPSRTPSQTGPQTDSDRESRRPPIRLLDLDDQPFDFWKQEEAATTVVLFTRSDCPISNRCAPEIRRLYETYHPRGVDFFLVYVDPREEPASIRRHMREYGYPCLGLRDPHHDLVAHCGATATPEAVVFNRERSITYLGRVDDLYLDISRSRAEATSHDLADAIESTLCCRPVAKPRTRATGCSIADLKE